MQTISASMGTVLRQRTAASPATIVRKPVLLFELYASDHFPDASGFNPVNAVQRFAGTGITWLGHTYRRQLLSHSDISRFMSGEFNGVDMTYANADLFMSGFVLTQEVEGLRLVVRYIERAASTTLADSVVLYVGRLKRPDGLDEEQCEIGSQQELASVNWEVPRRTFSPQDLLGRSPFDPLFEGFKFNAASGFFRIATTTTERRFFFFTRRRTTYSNVQWSSESNVSRDQVVPLIFGRCQMELIPMLWADVGFRFYALLAAAGHKVWEIGDVIVQGGGFVGPTQAHVNRHLGHPGGTGTNASVDGYFPNSGSLLSRTAYVGLTIIGPEDQFGHTPNAGQDQLPIMTAIVLGEADLPDGAGVYNQKGPTSNNAHLTRFALTSPDVFGLDPRLINDASFIKVAGLCDEIIQDDTNGDLLILDPNSAEALAQDLFHRFNSSGIINTNFFYHEIDPVLNPHPGLIGRTVADGLVYALEVFDDENPHIPPPDPEPPPPPDIVPRRFYRKRWTFNAPLTGKTKAIDFLQGTMLPSFRGFILTDALGRLELRTERPADSTYLRSNTLAGATEISVNDVEPWRLSTQGLVLIGVGLVTSETRPVTGTSYSTLGNSIPISASSPGAVNLTASGPTLTGGGGATPASGTFVLSGVASGQIIATIDGVAVSYTLNGDELQTAAGMLAALINATWVLKAYIQAVWDGNVTVTVFAKLGNLTVPALTNAHNVQLATPTVAPTASPVSGGSLTPGIYELAYSVTTATGETTVSPRQSITIAAGQRISVAATSVPTGGAGLNWYMSKAAGDPTIAFLISNVGATFLINVLPAPEATGEPLTNTAGEEAIRVMASFDQYSILGGKFRWPLSNSAVNQVLIKYISAAEDFAVRELYVNDYVHQRRIGQVNTEEIDGSGVDNFYQASVLANARLSKEREGNFRCEWDTDDYGIVHEEGDVVCCTDRSGGFVNLPVRIEQLLIHPDDGTGVNVTFTARLYSTRMLSDQPGIHPIILPTTLKYLTNPPPPVINVVLVESHKETPNTTWLTTIAGTFDFQPFTAAQIARIYYRVEGSTEYKLVDTVLPDPDMKGAFEILSVPLTIEAGIGHAVKIVTESEFGYTLGLAAATAYFVNIEGPPPIEAPVDFTVIWDRSNGDALVVWGEGFSNQTLTLSQKKFQLEFRNAADTAWVRSQQLNLAEIRNLQEFVIWDPDANIHEAPPPASLYLTLFPEGGIDLDNGDETEVTSLTSAEVVGGYLIQFQAAPNGVPLPTYMTIFPQSSFGFSGDFAFMWQCVDHSGPPHFDSVQRWWMYPEGFSGGEHDAFRQPMISGASYDIFIRPDGVVEYHVNFSPFTRPIFTSGRIVLIEELYFAFVRSNTNDQLASVRKVQQTRQGPEWKYIGDAQRIDHGLGSPPALPASFKARVRQLSPFINMRGSDWVEETFVRPT